MAQTGALFAAFEANGPMYASSSAVTLLLFFSFLPSEALAGFIYCSARFSVCEARIIRCINKCASLVVKQFRTILEGSGRVQGQTGGRYRIEGTRPMTTSDIFISMPSIRPILSPVGHNGPGRP
jgi:hypothetical protein